MERMKIIRKKIYDPILRLCHFGIAFFTTVLLLSAYSANYFYETGLFRKSLWMVHSFSGIVLSLFITVRIIWGILGPEHAKLKNLWKIKEWKFIWKSKNFNPKWDWGHHPIASLAYILFYFIISIMSVSGLVLAGIEHKLGPFAFYYDQLKYRHDLLEIHESFSLLVILFIVGHIGALFAHEIRDGLPVIQSMFSGYQYKSEGDLNESKTKTEPNDKNT